MASADPLAAFAGLQAPKKEEADFYPGSKKKRRAVQESEVAPVLFGFKPSRVKEVNGVVVRGYYSMPCLAEALERQPVTIYKWLTLGYLPESSYLTKGRDKYGRKRLYSRDQIEALRALADEEGLLAPNNRNVSGTNFPARAAKLMKRIK